MDMFIICLAFVCHFSVIMWYRFLAGACGNPQLLAIVETRASVKSCISSQGCQRRELPIGCYSYCCYCYLAASALKGAKGGSSPHPIKIAPSAQLYHILYMPIYDIYAIYAYSRAEKPMQPHLLSSST